MNILRLVLGDWSCAGNIKQVFLMIPAKLCFTKSAVNKSAYISEMPPNQPDYPWFLKCTLNLGIEKAMLINSISMSHLPPFSHRSNTTLFIKWAIHEFSWKKALSNLNVNEQFTVFNMTILTFWLFPMKLLHALKRISHGSIKELSP